MVSLSSSASSHPPSPQWQTCTVERLWQMDVLPWRSEKASVRSRQDEEAIALLEAKTVRVEVDGVQQHARDSSHSGNAARKAVEKSYVDNCMLSLTCEEEAIVLAEQLRNLLAEGRLDLRQWRAMSTQSSVIFPLRHNQTVPNAGLHRGNRTLKNRH